MSSRTNWFSSQLPSFLLLRCVFITCLFVHVMVIFAGQYGGVCLGLLEEVMRVFILFSSSFVFNVFFLVSLLLLVVLWCDVDSCYFVCVMLNFSYSLRRVLNVVYTEHSWLTCTLYDCNYRTFLRQMHLLSLLLPFQMSRFSQNDKIVEVKYTGSSRSYQHKWFIFLEIIKLVTFLVTLTLISVYFLLAWNFRVKWFC